MLGFNHRSLDPRSKLVLTVVIVGLAVAIPRLDALVVLFVLLMGVVALGAGLSLGSWLGSLTPLKWLLVIILVLNTLFYGGGTILWTIHAPGLPIRISTGGIETSILIATRLVVIASAASWVAMTTDQEVFEEALTRLGIPWSMAFLLSLTLRLVPELRDRFATIEEAQRSRGLTVSGGPIARARARLPLLIPFLVSVVEYGFELTEALVVRDFGIATHRTSIVTLTHGPGDYFLYGVSALVLGSYLTVFVVG